MLLLLLPRTQAHTYTRCNLSGYLVTLSPNAQITSLHNTSSSSHRRCVSLISTRFAVYVPVLVVVQGRPSATDITV